MTRLERLRAKLAEKESQYRQAVSQRQFTTLPKIQNAITDLKAQIAEAEEYEPKRLSELVDRETLKKHKIVDKIIKMHIAADFLEDCSVDLKQGLRRLGLEGCSLFPMTEEIRKRASDFAGLVCNPVFGGLMDFMLENDELIDELHEVVERYMARHLKEEPSL